MQGEALLRKRLLRETPILRAIRDPDFPLALAIQVAKIHVLPAPTYFLRALPFRVSKEPIAEFDCKLQPLCSSSSYGIYLLVSAGWKWWHWLA